MSDHALPQYDQLVTAIHSVVLEPGKWDAMLRRVGEAISASAGLFHLRDKTTGQMVHWHGFGHETRAVAKVAGTPELLANWYGPLGRVGEWIDDHARFNHPDIADHPFFRPFAEAGCHSLGARAFDDGHHEALISFQRKMPVTPFDDQGIALLRRLSPHLELACRLSSEFSRLRMQAAVARQALDRLAAPLWVVDGEGRVQFANQAAETTGLPGMCVRQGRLSADNPTLEARLQSLLMQASSRKPQSGALALERPAGGRLTVLVAPLPADSPLVADSKRPLVLLMAHDPSASEAEPLEVLAALYGLSPAECRLAALLLEGCSLAEAAQRLQLQQSTVRTQSKSMFWKTGTHRQGELLKLLSSAMLLKI
ncbi:hypothetical protein [Chitinimonas sp. BJYL2]|uniref:hypothetical protein n=1 Tax=Chitinimonas sp. BJYL2 TaxID=2976696 RepID=UPI0022B4B989|nr:hypothetical protein [Chitinimonas sp. BJYL2]